MTFRKILHDTHSFTRSAQVPHSQVLDKAYLCLCLLGILCYFLAIFSLLIVQLSVLALRAFR